MGKKGFTLIELMIVVAIVGILAAIGLGAYQDYEAKSRQTEARVNLEAIHTVAVSYQAEHGTYNCTADQLGWTPNLRTRYRYWYNHSIAANTPSDYYSGIDYSDPGSGADSRGFTAYAVGNVSGGTNHDIWMTNNSRGLANTVVGVARQ